MSTELFKTKAGLCTMGFLHLQPMAGLQGGIFARGGSQCADGLHIAGDLNPDDVLNGNSLRPYFVFLGVCAWGARAHGLRGIIVLQKASSTTTSVDDAPASVPGVRGSSYRVASLWLLVR